MRLVLTVLALTLLASTAEAVSYRDHDGDSSHPLDFRIGAYHTGFGDSRSTRALTIDTSPSSPWWKPRAPSSDRQRRVTP